MVYAAIIGLLTIQAAQSPGDTAGVDPLYVFSGDWQIVDTQTDEVAQDCNKAQSFTVTPDRKTVVLTEKWADNWTSRYTVVHSEENRVLLFIENEERKTQWGDPILWWAYFDGPDKFRWRRYDWEPGNSTAAEWRRCPSA